MEISRSKVEDMQCNQMLYEPTTASTYTGRDVLRPCQKHQRASHQSSTNTLLSTSGERRALVDFAGDPLCVMDAGLAYRGGGDARRLPVSPPGSSHYAERQGDRRQGGGEGTGADISQLARTYSARALWWYGGQALPRELCLAGRGSHCGGRQGSTETRGPCTARRR